VARAAPPPSGTDLRATRRIDVRSDADIAAHPRQPARALTASSDRRAVVNSCDRFVGRTTNWLYDHLRFVPRHEPFVYCGDLSNRAEFPLLQARRRASWRLSHRAWRRVMGERLFPTDAFWLRRRRPAALHSHFGYVAVNDFSLHAALGVPWLVGFYGADVYELGRLPEWQDKYAPLFARAQRVLALGPEMARALEEIGCPRPKILVHALCVDAGSIPSRPRIMRRGEPLKILFAGTFREKKGIEYVVRGAAAARRHGVPLHLTLIGDAGTKAGDRKTKDAVFAEIRRLDMESAITYHKFVEFERLLEMALASHVFVAPSVTGEDGDAEGTPFVLQQMMATGMAVIATRHSDIPFIFGEHADQLLPERDADAITARLVAYAEDPERLVRDGAMMSQRIRAALDVRHCAARLSEIYDEVLSS
jgi:colanic acid/amylovoran/stewartan biosynthesis glycosyltransferase WcaL/AmsK/CpsK